MGCAEENSCPETVTEAVPSDAASFDDFHRFGGPWTLLKLEAVEKYLAAFTGALKRQRFELHYLDAFAGTGRCDITDGSETFVAQGSAVRALGVAPPFHSFTFIEKRSRSIESLARLRDANPDRAIEVIQGDANEVLTSKCERKAEWEHRRAVAFLDPYGMNVEWSTLQSIASTEAIDAWYLFPLSGVVRQAARNPASVDLKKAESLTRTLGTDEWRTAWYRPKSQQSLFAETVEEERHADHTQITDWITARLLGIFPGVEGPRIFFNTRNGREHSPLFALYFLVSNPKPAARDLACRMARHIIKNT